MSGRTATEPRAIARMLIGVGSWGCAAVLYAVAVRTASGRRADETAFQQMRENLAGRSWIPDGDALAHTQLTLLLIGVGVVCATCLVNRYTSRTTVVSIALGCAPGLVADVLKGTLSRPWSPGEFVAHNSFPSGTVAAFAGVAAALTFVARTRLQQCIAGTACAGTGLVALIVIRAHWHRPSDVIGACLLALGAWAIASAVAPQRSRPEVRRAEPRTLAHVASMDSSMDSTAPH